jgi:quercetin dioxygenase-like cupin family protein
MEARDDGAYVLGPGEGRSIDLGTFEVSLKADRERTGAVLSLFEATEPPNFGPPMHVHRDAGEGFYVLEGEYVMFIGADEYRGPAGSFIWVPPGVVHGFRVGGVPSRKLNVYAPAAMVGYFDEVSAAVREGAVSDERLSEIAAAYSMDVLGPVPEGYM